MKLLSLPWSSITNVISRNNLALLIGVVPCWLSPSSSQSVTFMGAQFSQATLDAIARDTAGNLNIAYTAVMPCSSSAPPRSTSEYKFPPDQSNPADMV
jgi:hypothetical protein